jgi:hypothetical protein
MGIGQEAPHLSRKAVAAMKTNYCSIMNLENDLRVAISKLQPRYDKLCSNKQPHLPH